MRVVMSPYELKAKYKFHHPNGHFFDHDTLKFFGETMSNMSVLKQTATITDILGKKHECYVLSSLQRKHPMGARRVYHYFDIKTLDHV